MAVTKIISGGQTGADQGGLEAAARLNIPTGGWIPQGWRTEDGPQPRLAAYGLKQHPSSSYPPRTRLNIRDSQGTAIFGDIKEGGSKLTAGICLELQRPFIHISMTASRAVHVAVFREWLKVHKIGVLNIAGNRESKSPGIQQWVNDFLTEALEVK